MMLTKSRPLALGGGCLHGRKPVYYIYSDEAGTSAREPITVVVGVLIHADRHWRAAADFLQEVLDDHIPKPLRPGFVFHATDVWSGYREYDNVWSREDRADCIAAVASIPRILGAALAVGKVRRDAGAPDNTPIPMEDLQHLMAFWLCMGRANKYVRDWGEEGEVATLVAEDVPKKRKLLKIALRMPQAAHEIDELHVRPAREDREAGRIVQTLAGDIDRIIDTVHFVEKDEAPLLQLADACAFSFRRYFAGHSHGEQLVTAMLGEPLVWDDWQGPSSSMVFSSIPAPL